MRKVIGLYVALVFITLLIGCKQNKIITVLIPQGSPEIASIYIIDNERYKVDIVNGADPLIAAFSSLSHDVIIAPTNLGAKLYQSKPSFIMLGVLVEGNYYLASRNQDLDNIYDIDGKELVIFGKNQTSDIILSFILEELDITCNITYVDNITTASSMLILNPDLIILTAEPSLSILNQTYPNLNTLDLLPYYQDLTENSYPQASIFVKSDLDQDTLSQIELDFKSSAERVNVYPKESALLAIENGIMIDGSILEQAILQSNINYQNAWDAKWMIEHYFDLIYGINPALIGQNLPDDSFYYRGKNDD